MTKFYLSLAAVCAVSTTAPAFAAETQTLTRDGATYVYSVQETPKGQVIRGREMGGSPFLLRVSNGRVSGSSNGHYVSFALSEVAPSSAKQTELSSR